MKNKFKGLNLIDRVPKELWTEVHDIVQAAVIKTTPSKNNRMGKTRDLFKKIRDTKGPFHAKMSTIKDRYGMDLKK